MQRAQLPGRTVLKLIQVQTPNLSVCQSEHDKEVIDQKVQQVGTVWNSASGTMQ